jgi:type IV pilus assembly protein PilE
MTNSIAPRIHLGFSLLELICVVIIIAILVAVAYPGYLNVVAASRRAEGKSALHAILIQQERYYLHHNTYLAFDSDSRDGQFKWWSGTSAASSFYEIRATPCPNKLLTQCVLITGYPGTEKVKSFVDPVCGNLMLDSANNKTYSVSTEPNSTCW